MREPFVAAVEEGWGVIVAGQFGKKGKKGEAHVTASIVQSKIRLEIR